MSPDALKHVKRHKCTEIWIQGLPYLCHAILIWLNFMKFYLFVGNYVSGITLDVASVSY